MDFDPWNDDLEHLFDDDPPPPPLSLTSVQRAALADHVGRAVRERECDGTLRSAQRWAAQDRSSWSRLRAELDAHGVYCDCELLELLSESGGGPAPPTSP